MAYSKIINAEFYDISNSFWQLEIEQQAYAGAVTNVEKMGSVPMRFDYGKSAVLPQKAPVFDTRLNFTLESSATLQFDYLFDNNPRKHRVTVKYKGSTYFIGFFVPATYSEPFRPAPFFVSFSATDGLILLKNRDWDVTDRLTELLVIVRCLKETGLTLDITTSISTELITPLALANPLEAVYEPGEQYIEAESTYFDVLEDILKKYGATIKQAAGKWVIQQFNDQANALPVTRTYDSAGVLQSTGTTAAVIAPSGTGVNNNMAILNSSVLRINPAFKEFTINQELVAAENIFRNGDLDETVPNAIGWPVLKDWQSNVTVLQLPHAGGDCAAMLEWRTDNPITANLQLTDPNQPYIKQNAGRIGADNYDNVDRESVILKLDIKYGLSGSTEKILQGDVYAKLKVGSKSAKIDYIDGTAIASWTIGDYVFKVGRPTARSVDNLIFDEFSVEFSPFILQDGYIEIYLYSAINCDEYLLEKLEATVFDSVTLTPIYVDGSKPNTDKKVFTEIDANSPYIPKDIDIIVADLPDLPFAYFTYRNFLQDEAGYPTRKWRYLTPDGLTVEDELLVILAAQVTGLFSQPRLLFQANIVSDILNFCSRISYPGKLGTRVFAMLRGSFEPKKLAWTSVEALEVTIETLPDFDSADLDNVDFDTD